MAGPFAVTVRRPMRTPQDSGEGIPFVPGIEVTATKTWWTLGLIIVLAWVAWKRLPAGGRGMRGGKALW